MNKSLPIILLFILGSLMLPAQAASEDENQPAKAVYFKIEEAFTINFLNQSDKKARYMQISVTLKAHDPEVIKSAEMNLPMIQDALRTLFTAQRLETVNSVEGRRSLQAKALESIKNILKAETNRDELDAVYFTKFILQ